MPKLHYKTEYDSYTEFLVAKEIAEKDMKDEFSELTEEKISLEDRFNDDF